MIFFIVLALGFQSANAYEQNVQEKNAAVRPADMEGIGIDAKLGESIDLSLKFKNDRGEEIQLADIWNKDRPVFLSLVYYSCPSLCNFHLNGLIDSMKKMKWNPGQEFDVVAVSIDPKEDPLLAAAKKESYMEMYGRPETANGWHFLTGSQENIKKLADQVGFKYKWVESKKEWAHASAAIVTSPQGLISRYLYGVVFTPRDMRLAASEASEGKVGNVIDQLLLFCFRFDPEKNKYSLYAFNVMRAGGGLTVVLLILLLAPMWFRSRRDQRS